MLGGMEKPVDEQNYRYYLSNPVPLPDLYFDSFSCPVASLVFGGMAI